LNRSNGEGFTWKINLPVLESKIDVISDGIDESSPCEVPALFIRGEKSDYITDQDIDIIRELFPNYTLVSIDAGHWIQAEKPQEFVNAVKTFLNS
jgi:pimeloyl-ACP methyl ester carboxylesterase